MPGASCISAAWMARRASAAASAAAGAGAAGGGARAPAAAVGARVRRLRGPAAPSPPAAAPSGAAPTAASGTGAAASLPAARVRRPRLAPSAAAGGGAAPAAAPAAPSEALRPSGAPGAPSPAAGGGPAAVVLRGRLGRRGAAAPSPRPPGDAEHTHGRCHGDGPGLVTGRLTAAKSAGATRGREAAEHALPQAGTRALFGPSGAVLPRIGNPGALICR